MAWEREMELVASLNEGDVVVLRGLRHDLAGIVVQTDVIDLRILVTSPECHPDCGRMTWENASRVKAIHPPGTEIEIETDAEYRQAKPSGWQSVDFYEVSEYIRLAGKSEAVEKERKTAAQTVHRQLIAARVAREKERADEEEKNGKALVVVATDASEPDGDGAGRRRPGTVWDLDEIVF